MKTIIILTTKEARKLIGRDMRMGTPASLTSYFAADCGTEIQCTDDERKEYERSFGRELTACDTLDPVEWSVFATWLKDNAGLKLHFAGHATSVGSDPAAEFTAALSLYKFGSKQAKANRNNLSDAYSGGDEFQRQCMRIGREFERWACDHINFDELGEVWPYYLEDKFGAAAVDVAGSECDLEKLGENHWPLIAAKLMCPLRAPQWVIKAPKFLAKH